eukprot:5342497-Pyramimonas_sp.AAC.1
MGGLREAGQVSQGPRQVWTPVLVPGAPSGDNSVDRRWLRRLQESTQIKKWRNSSAVITYDIVVEFNSERCGTIFWGCGRLWNGERRISSVRSISVLKDFDFDCGIAFEVDSNAAIAIANQWGRGLSRHFEVFPL